MSDSVSTMKSLADNLATVGKGVEEDDLISYILVGLGAEYDPVVVNITGRTYQLTLQEVFSLLLNHESRLEQLNTVSFVPEQDTNAIHDNFVQTNNKRQGGGNFHSMNTRGGSRGRGRGRTHYGKGGNNRPTCQICGKYGHSASTCYWRFNEEFSGGKQNINQASAYMAHSDEKGEHGWYFDSGTTHRITNYLSDLNIKTELKGGEKLMIGDSNSLTITHIGDVFVSVHNKTVSLKNLLFVPEIKKKLISVSKFVSDNNLILEFHGDVCVVKDKE